MSEETGASESSSGLSATIAAVPRPIRTAIWIGLGFSVVAAIGYLFFGWLSQAALSSWKWIFGEAFKTALTFTLIAVGGAYIKVLGDSLLDDQRNQQAELKEQEDRRRSIIDEFAAIYSEFYSIRKLHESARDNKEKKDQSYSYDEPQYKNLLQDLLKKRRS